MQIFNILIVDDDHDVAESLALVFEGRGHRVGLAYSAEEALEKSRNVTFDITFLDVKLPGMNGVECFEEMIRRRPKAKIVMMTGYSVEELLDRARNQGAWAVLYKPLNIKHLLKLLDGIDS